MNKIKQYYKKSKQNKTAFWAEIIEQPFIIIGSMFTGVNVIVNPTMWAAVGFGCFVIGSIAGLVSSIKRTNMNVITVGYHTLLNIVTFSIVLWKLI